MAYVNTWYTSEALAGRLIVVRVVDGTSGLEIVPNSAVAASSLAAGPEAPAWSNDGVEIAFLNRSGFGNALQVLPVFVTSTGITFGSVRTLYDSGIVTDYGPYHGLANRPTWSPDDSWIAFQVQVGGEPDGTKAFDLFRVPSGGGPVINVTNGAGRATYPRLESVVESQSMKTAGNNACRIALTNHER